ncbi:hypothetical protein CYY_003195 [Polysphondylium violaceum]|uniref:Uncharacterized protein n=1 Tax=Polysphondylium violaceum TaxID=133409 RepID=A0A8J4PWX1_9MYCE|nr:hypothetical protein CYY_003195 [Polysphondylium violaceum]
MVKSKRTIPLKETQKKKQIKIEKEEDDEIIVKQEELYTDDDEETINIKQEQEDEEEDQQVETYDIKLEGEEEEEEEEDQDQEEQEEDQEEEEEDQEDGVDIKQEQDEEEEDEEDKEEEEVRKKLDFLDKLSDRFINTLASTFIQNYGSQLETLGKNRLRNFYFESIHQINNTEIRELLFRPKAWNKFYFLLKSGIKQLKQEVSLEINDKEEIQGDQDEDEDQDVEKDDDGELSKVVFKNIHSYQTVGGRESLIYLLDEKPLDQVKHLYNQAILSSILDDSLLESFIKKQVSNEQQKGKQTSGSKFLLSLLDQFIMLTITNNSNNNLNHNINLFNYLLNLIIDTKEQSIIQESYNLLQKFLTVSVLNQLHNNNNKDIEIQKSYVDLASSLFKLSLMKHKQNNGFDQNTDFSVIKLLLGNSNYLPKLVNMLTNLDFTLDQYIPSKANTILSIFLQQFIQETLVNPQPTSSMAYLKARILCERGIIVLTKIKDPLLTKLKISSASLAPPENLLNILKENANLVTKTHSNMNDTQALRLLKLDGIMKLFNKVEEIQNLTKQQEQEEQEQDDDAVAEGTQYVVEKSVVNGDSTENKEDDDSQDPDQPKNLLDFLDEDDLISDTD